MRKSGRLTKFRMSAVSAFLALTTSVWVLTATATPQAAGPVACPVGANPVACENLQSGTPFTDWYSPNAWGAIQGFTTTESVQPGETLRLKVQSPASYKVDFYRLGWYQGAGARLMPWSPATTYPSNMGASPAACLTNSTTGLVDCGNWPTTVTVTIPADAVSGLYLAGLDQTDGNGYMPYPFVVRSDASHSAVVVQTSDQTWQAYNSYGGRNLYDGNGPAPDGRAYQVSYNRPFANGGNNGVFGSEYAMISWLERNGYDVSYLSGVDVSTRPADVANHKVFISDGHDEYWSQPQFDNVMAARKAGTSLGFFSGNEVFWRTRLAPSADAGAEADRTLVCYKMTKLELSPPSGIPDPTGTWTGTWMDPNGAGTGGNQPQNQLTGSIFNVNAYQNSGISVPSVYAPMRLWRDTSVATTPTGQSAVFQNGTLGYEWDSDLTNSTRPSGQIQLSSTTLAVDQLRLDYGNTYGAGTATHNLIEYRDPTSHALVFGAGTVQWSWGLDAVHSDAATNEDPRMQQATVNVLADMGVQPQTLQANLVRAAISTDAVGPTTTVTAPLSGVTVPVLRPVTVSGSALDTGGGVVARTEVSVDGGTTWNLVSGLTQWSYSWTPMRTGPAQIIARAIDDSVNIGASTTVNLTVGPQQCPCSVWPNSAAPTRADGGDGGAVTLGTKFRTTAAGSVTGIRFYKSPLNTGTHTGTLWSNTGQLLATGTFSSESASGWQTLSFANPVPVKANTTYIASYHAPNGHYSADAGYFTSQGAGLAPIQALKSGTDGADGVFSYTSAPPTSGYNDTAYWVDAVFDTSAAPTNPPTVVTESPGAGANSVAITAPVSASFSQAMDITTLAFTVQDSGGVPVNGTVTYTSATNTATFTPSGQLALGTVYYVSVQGSDLWGGAMAGPVTWSFTTSSTPPNPACPCSLWSAGTTPAVADSGDAGAVNLGTRFTSSVAGSVTGVRFYKSAANTGTHTGTLWSASGQQLATGTFTGESASGWQTLTFATPVAITAGTPYVVSYHVSNGHYSVSSGYFTGPHSAYPLTAPADAAGAGNGVYAYGTASGFPSSSYNATDYWVDVTFTTSGSVATASAPAPNAGTPQATRALITKSAAVGLDPVMDTTHPISTVLPPESDPSTVKMTVVTAAPVSGQEWKAGTAMPGTVSFDAVTRTVSFRPAAPLLRTGAYTVVVTADSRADDPLPPVTWTIRPTSPPTRAPVQNSPAGVAPGVIPGQQSLGSRRNAPALL